MAMLRMITPKAGDWSMFDSVTFNNATYGIDTTTYRTPDSTLVAGKSFKITPTTTSPYVQAYINLPVAKSTLYLKFALKFEGSANEDITVLRLYEGAGVTLHGRLDVNPGSGVVTTKRDTTTLLASASGVFNPAVWNLFEVYWLSGDTTAGAFQVKINGTLAATYVGCDTRNAGTAGTISQIRLGMISALSYEQVMYMDDIAVRDDTWCGQGGIFALPITGNGVDQGFTASAGNAWDCINELPADWADYITAPVAAGTRSIFDILDFPATISSVSCVGVFAKARLNIAGTGNAKTVAKSGATINYGTSTALSTTEQWLQHYMDVDPADSGAWTQADINALKVGVETS